MNVQLDPVTYRQKIGDFDCVIVDPQKKDFTPKSIVVLCHGFGAPGADLVPCSQSIINLQPETTGYTRFVFPVAPMDLEPGYDSRAWWPIDMEKLQAMIEQNEFRDLHNESPKLLATRRMQLTKLVDSLLQDNSLEYSNLILGGFSQGAMLTTDVALHLDNPIGGLIVWSGTLINEFAWKEKLCTAKTFPVFQSHGESDPILPIAGASLLHDLFVDHEFPSTFVEFRGMHEIPMPAMRGASNLISQVIKSGNL